MATVTSLGSGSGLDLEGLVTKLVSAESTALSRLQTKSGGISAKISSIGQFTSLISALQSSVQDLQDGSKMVGMKATSGNTAAFSAVAKSTASVGSHSIDVLQLAQGQRLVSNSGASGFSSSTDALSVSTDNVASAKITITYGTVGGGGTLTAGSQTPMTVNVTPDTDGKITLASVRDAINAAKGAVSASLVKESDSSTRLVLTGSGVGASNAFSVDVALSDSNAVELYNSAVNGSTTTTAFSKLVYHPGSASIYTAKQEAKDAHVVLDGVDIYRSSNTLSDILDGVTLTLSGTTIPSGSATSVASTLQIASDSSGISTALQGMVTAYNNVQKAISSATSFNAETKKGGVLQGDAMVRSLQSQLRSMISAKFGATGNSIATLSDLGVTFQKNGTLALDSTKLGKAVSADLDAVQNFLGSYDKTTNISVPDSAKVGFSYQLNQLTTTMLGSDGLINSKISGLNQTVKLIDSQLVSEQSRLSKREAFYRKQFTALDKSIASMKATSTYLTQQLASLSSLSSSSSENN